MVKKKFFETDEFKKLNEEWSKKLEASGFDDIEKTEDGYTLRPQEFITNKVKYVGGQDYYDFCQQVLRDYPFKRDIDKFIFEAHTEGKSEREIEVLLSKHSYKSLTSVRIHQIIRKIKEDFSRVS